MPERAQVAAYIRRALLDYYNTGDRGEIDRVCTKYRVASFDYPSAWALPTPTGKEISMLVVEFVEIVFG